LKFFILRHGITGDAPTDEERDLTANGRAEVVKIIKQKLEHLGDVQQIFSSPMVRVKNTLDIAANLMKFEGEIVIEENLGTGNRLDELKDFLGRIDIGAGDVMVSSHQSCTSIIVLWLTGEDVLIPNGSLICIEAEELGRGTGAILWQESASGQDIKRTELFADMI